MRQTRGGVCRLRNQIARYMFPEEGSVEKSLSYQARREVLQQMAPQYRQASASEKRTVLDTFVATTGYVRKYARRLLNHAEEVQQTHGRSQLRKYGPQVQNVLFLVWNAANRICAKRLIHSCPP
jgi:endonuclease III